ncbi:MAG: ImmA/IrrE family metallo-endopeptidase [Solirubrobacterales bacterium]
MSKRPAGALAGIAMILLLAAPATRAALPPVRDVVLDRAGLPAAQISATASTSRYPINDGSGATIGVSATSACEVSCNAADPQQIADFIGTLIHGSEVSLLTVQLDTPSQVEFDCGFGAEACYYSGENLIVISGDDTPDEEGVSREFILAHEYGHHVAQHRQSPAPFPAAIDWGPARWSSYEHVCQLRRAREVFPGDEGTHYFEDPGEAWAESFAHYRFPHAHVKWPWLASMKPDAGAFRAIREDTLHPWMGRTSFQLAGRVPARSSGTTVESFRTPIDGEVSLRPTGADSHRYELSLQSKTGRRLRAFRDRAGPTPQLNFTVCGQSRLRAVLSSLRRAGGPFTLQIQRP